MTAASICTILIRSNAIIIRSNAIIIASRSCNIGAPALLRGAVMCRQVTKFNGCLGVSINSIFACSFSARNYDNGCVNSSLVRD